MFRNSRPEQPTQALLRALGGLSRVLCALLLLLFAVGGKAVAQVSITGLSVSEASLGTEFQITGTGFGNGVPQVYLVQDGVKVKGNKLKAFAPVSDGLVVVQVKKAVAGVYHVVIDPPGNAAGSAESEDTLEILRPTIVGIEGETALFPGDELLLVVADLGTAKPAVRVAGLKAKLLSSEPFAGEGGEDLTLLSVLVPSGTPTGVWEVELSTPVGGDLLPGALVVADGNPSLGKIRLDAQIVGRGALSAKGSGVGVATSFLGPTTVSASSGGKQPLRIELVLPFVVGNEQAPQSYDGAPAVLRLFDEAGQEWLAADDDFVIDVGANRDGLVAGSFSGDVFPAEEGSGLIHLYGRFVYDGSYDLVDGGGNTSKDLDKAEPAPGVNLQVLELSGASGPTGNFQPGDTLAVTFRLAKDDGTSWHLDEMTAARGAVSGPTFNYQRVLAQVSDIVAASTDEGNDIYTYRFPVPIPATYLPPLNDSPALGPEVGELTGQPLLDGTYTLGLWFYWGYTAGEEDFRDVGTVTVDFLIGSSVASVQPREVVTTAHCNQCHSDLQFHGGTRRGVEICVLCHNSGAEDRNIASAAGGTPGTTIDLGVMIHRIHNGVHLPSVNGVGVDGNGNKDYTVEPKDYVIVSGGGTIHDYSEVAFPAWPNLVSPMPKDFGYSALGSFQAQENAILSGMTGCNICHGDPDGSGPIEAPSQGDLAYSSPRRDICQSCHDDWDPGLPYISNTGAGMPADLPDTGCNQCHPHDGSDLAVEDAHLHPLRNPDFAGGVNFNILSVDEDGLQDGDGTIDPGEKLAVTFTITDDAGVTLDASQLAGRSAVLTGPSGNRNIILPEQALPAEMLTGSQPFTINLPMRVYLEPIGTATSDPDVFATQYTPQWNVTGHLTEVRERTGFGAGSSETTGFVDAPVNYVDVVDATGFLRDDYIVIDAGNANEEYLRIQVVQGNRLWFSSPYTQAYAPGPRLDHPAGTTVDEVVLTSLTAGVDYSLDLGKGTVTELAPFDDGNPILVTYSTDFVMPETYPIALNGGPDLDERTGTWAGKSIVSGTYSLTMWGSRALTLDLHGESNSYRDGSEAVRHDFLVGEADTIEPYRLISSVATCQACHVDMQFHGGNRGGFESCFSCHSTAGAGDRPVYVAPGSPVADSTVGVTVNFREMIHKIHRGSSLALADEYVVRGFGSGFPNNFTEHKYDHVNFPAMPEGVMDCFRCHGESDAWMTPSNRQHPTEQVLAGQEWRIACGSCHDSDAEQAHIQAQTSPTTGAESCLVCHGPGNTWDVERMHKVR